ncbi:transcription factor bHLH30-like isoform X2 [Salvia hispanica]|uniref:transcription factor bHLH30-like isoform X2 n=1 Tax=Salvia hispanica TaxID=49212 RepID=UPI002009C644|nr:transcription factor bHLH30-like isoform X2 [Salvia hispanica]
MMQCDNNQYGISFDSDGGQFVNQLLHSSENRGCLSLPVKQSLVLDGEKGELVKACGKVGRKRGVSETKTAEALRSHSEAERRRRERINAHLESLRGLVPSNEKMDKATLLAEVVSQIKQLRATASQASEGLQIPMDTDEVKVETIENHSGDGSFLLRASICCEHWPDLLSDVRQVIRSLPVRVLKTEISTLGSRVKVAFLITSVEGDIVVGSVRAALSDVLEKVSVLVESAEQLFIPRKRQRVSCLDSSSCLLQ